MSSSRSSRRCAATERWPLAGLPSLGASSSRAAVLCSGLGRGSPCSRRYRRRPQRSRSSGQTIHDAARPVGSLRGEPGRLVGAVRPLPVCRRPTLSFRDLVRRVALGVASRGAADEPLGRADDRSRGRGRALLCHARAGQGGLQRQHRAALLDGVRQCRCGAPDPDVTGRGGYHSRRDRVLDHDRDADAGLDAVRAQDAPQLHPRSRHPVHARHVRRDVRVRDARADLDQRTSQPRGGTSSRIFRSRSPSDWSPSRWRSSSTSFTTSRCRFSFRR